jgi:hypothetical protein
MVITCSCSAMKAAVTLYGGLVLSAPELCTTSQTSKAAPLSTAMDTCSCVRFLAAASIAAWLLATRCKAHVLTDMLHYFADPDMLLVRKSGRLKTVMGITCNTEYVVNTS